MGVSVNTSANSKQIGGDHYKKMPMEHWDLVALAGLDYYQGNITKYVMRWRDKGGIEDLKKARHYLDKYIELEELRAARGDNGMRKQLLRETYNKTQVTLGDLLHEHTHCGATLGRSTCELEHGHQGPHTAGGIGWLTEV
jgi:hypothetical protein